MKKTIRSRITAIALAAIFVIALMPFGVFTVSASTHMHKTVFSTGFETDPFSGTNSWYQYDFDGDGHTWVRLETVDAHSGSYVMTSESWAGEALNPNNRLWTPYFDVPAAGHTTLTFWARGTNSSYYQEHILPSYAYAGDALVPHQISEFVTNYEWTQYSVDLTRFAGRRISICFLHYNCTDQNRIYLDDVSIENDFTYAVNDGLGEIINNSEQDLTFISDAEYGWKSFYDPTFGSYYVRSGNEGMHNSISSMQTTVNFYAPTTVTFDYMAMGESNQYIVYDSCVFAVDDIEAMSVGRQEGEGWKTYAAQIPAGTHTLTWTYAKDKSNHPKGDFFAVKNLQFGIRTYDLKIAGTTVTNANAFDILENGVFSYDYTSNVLTVNGDYTLNGSSAAIIESYIEDLTIYVAKRSRLTSNDNWSALILHDSTTIASDGKSLVIENKGDGDGIYFTANGKTLTVYQTYLYAKGANGISASGYVTNKLDLRYAGISAHATANYGYAIRYFGGGADMVGCHFSDYLSYIDSTNGVACNQYGEPLKDAYISTDEVNLYGYVYKDPFNDGLKGEVVSFDPFDPENFDECENFTNDHTEAMTYADGYVCGFDFDGYYFRSAFCGNPYQSEETKYVGQIFDPERFTVTDCAYDYNTEQLYSLVYDASDYCQYIYVTKNVETGESKKLFKTPVWLESIDFDYEGNLCAIAYEESDFFFVTLNRNDGKIIDSVYFLGEAPEFVPYVFYSSKVPIRLTYDSATGCFYVGADDENGTQIFCLDWYGHYSHCFTTFAQAFGKDMLTYTALFSVPDVIISPYYIYSWDFEEGDPYIAENDGFTFDETNGNRFSYDNDSSLAFNGSGYITSRKKDNGKSYAMAATPLFDLSSSPEELIVRISSEDEDKLQNFSIYVSTSDDFVCIASHVEAAFGYHTYRYDLSAFAEKRIQLVFFHEYNDTNGFLSIDNVELRYKRQSDERRGDVDGNGIIEAKDYLMTKRAVLKSFQLDSDQEYRDDIDGNGAVEASDYLKIKRHVLGTYTIEGWDEK